MDSLEKSNNATKGNEILSINQIKKESVLAHIDASLTQLKNLMNKYTDNKETISIADELAYWIEDYCRYLGFKNNFNPTYLKTYQRGDIIKVNLGHNVGNEESGLHYCVVLDKSNANSSGIITVIPLTSYKGKPIHYSSVFLGNEIYKTFKLKYDALMLEFSSKIVDLNVSKASQDELESVLEDLNIVKKMDTEMSKMKKGSVALCSQITTVSKQKIVDPQRKSDILADLKLSDKSLDLINNKIKQLYVK